jgi:hypothetical protein
MIVTASNQREQKQEIALGVRATSSSHNASYGHLTYIASPYSFKREDGSDCRQTMRQRAHAVEWFAGHLMTQGRVVYSPIAHCHHIADKHELPRTWEFWREFDFTTLSRCDELIVLMLDGWHKSVGVAAEVEFALARGIPVVYMSLPEEYTCP